MASYATVQNVKDRTSRTFTADEETRIATLLADAGIIIDLANANAPAALKELISCRMVIRVIEADGEIMRGGATQGSMSAGGYSQSWTMGSGGGSGELYLSKTDKNMLGVSNKIGSYSPVQEMVVAPLD